MKQNKRKNLVFEIADHLYGAQNQLAMSENLLYPNLL